MNSLTADQSRFLLANFAALSIAIPYKFVPRAWRHEYNYLPGILMVYYCFGRQANCLVLFSAISYIICNCAPSKYVGVITMLSSLAFLSYAHLSRQILDYGGYVLDISGPFMIAVQKMTSLGFCLHDGGLEVAEIERKSGKTIDDKEISNNQFVRKRVNDLNNNINNSSSYETKTYLLSNNNQEKQTGASDQQQENDNETFTDKTSSAGPKSAESTDSMTGIKIKRDKGLDTDEQRRYAVIRVPKFNEFMGYFFHFPSVLCGPMMYYNDYSDFVNTPQNKPVPPGREWAVLKKLTISISCALLHLTLNQRFEIGLFRSPVFLIQTPFIIKFCYLFVFTVLSRLKYYVAWHLGEAISNTTGLGFNGYDSKGEAKWNLISNMDLWKFETSLNFREAIHAWNKTTQSWLRRTAYERAPRKLAVILTYILSAMWHGFYPGYYMTFLGGALFTIASRSGRRVFRPKFQRGSILPKVYDVITFILTRMAIAYVAFPFVILDYHNNIEIYKSLYFSIHILGVVGVILGWWCS